MAFCSFDDAAALFDCTPVENMFITEYMLRAPGDFVKVYLYALMLCYHPSARMSLRVMARDLDMPDEEVARAFKYWARSGLVRQTGDNPPTFTLVNLKQLTLTQAENPAEKLYRRDFADEVRRILGGRELPPQDMDKVWDWLDVLELPEEVVLMLLQTEMKQSGGRVSMRIADEHAQEWAQSGVRTVEDVERIVLLGREREQQLRRLLARMGQRRPPSDDEKTLYRKWVDEWGFSPEAIQEACRETTKGTPTMAYLDGILLRQHQLGRHEARALEEGMRAEHTVRDFAREVYAGLGRTGITPTAEDLALIARWREDGADDSLILLAAAAAHRRAGGGNMEDIEGWLTRWRSRGLLTAEAVRADAARTRALNAQLRTLYDAAGLEKRPGAADRDLLSRWAGEWALPDAVILLAAQYARGTAEPMRTMARILSDWHAAGITTPAAAQAEHEAHLRGVGAAKPAASRAETPANRDMLQRHTPQERRATYSAAVVDFDEEDEPT